MTDKQKNILAAIITGMMVIGASTLIGIFGVQVGIVIFGGTVCVSLVIILLYFLIREIIEIIEEVAG